MPLTPDDRAAVLRAIVSLYADLWGQFRAVVAVVEDFAPPDFAERVQAELRQNREEWTLQALRRAERVLGLPTLTDEDLRRLLGDEP
jgi:hypothetical protein